RPRGLMAIWAMRRSLSVPRSVVSSVRTGVDRRSLRAWLRTFGTGMPGLVQAGAFRSTAGRSFWVVGRARRVTVIDCPGWTFDQVVVELGPAAQQALRELASQDGPTARPD